MRLPAFALLPVLLLTLPFGPDDALAASEYDEQVQGIVDQLRDIAERARKERAADRWVIHSLEDLISQHEWPWREEILSEDFADGDYTQQPSWQVLSGEFWVDASLGLRSRARAATPPPPAAAKKGSDKDLGSALLGALLQEALRTQPREAEPTAQPKEGPAEIRLPLRIPGTFALKAEFSAHNPPSESGQLQFSLYQDPRADQGYQLSLVTGARPSLDLLQLRDGRSLLIESAQVADLNDGQSHELEWRKNPDGEVELLLDGQSLLRIHDRAFSQGFSHLGISNQAGDFGVRSVQVYGQRK